MEDLPQVTISPQRAQMKRSELTKEEKSLYRSLVGKLNWAVRGTRPDLSYEVVDLSTRFHNATVSELIRASKNIKKLKSECECA